jgi:carbon storage regulator
VVQANWKEYSKNSRALLPIESVVDLYYRRLIVPRSKRDSIKSNGDAIIMLALSRKEGQTIVIDHEIKVTVLSIRGNRITLGIEAPPSVQIRRAEIAKMLSVNIDPMQPSLPLAASATCLG